MFILKLKEKKKKPGFICNMIYVKIEEKNTVRQTQDNFYLLKVLQKLKETKLQSRKEKSRHCNKIHVN